MALWWLLKFFYKRQGDRLKNIYEWKKKKRAPENRILKGKTLW